MAKYNLTVNIENTNTGFSAYVDEVPGLTTVGNNIPQLKANFEEVLEYHIGYLIENGLAAEKNDFEINYVEVNED